MTKLRLWISPGACSLAPHALLQEAGLDYELVVIDVTKGRFPEDKKHINPKGRIPILEYDGQILTETTAIMTLISRMVPEKALFGTTDWEVAQTYEWLNWLSGTVHERGMGAMFSPQFYSDDPEAHAGIRKKSREFVDQCFQLIEDRLTKTGGEHATNAQFTAADVFLWVVFRWGYLIRIDMEGKYPSWAKVVAHVAERKAIQATVEKEGIPLVKDDRLPVEEAAKYATKE